MWLNSPSRCHDIYLDWLRWKGILYCKFGVCKSTKATSIKPTRRFFYFYSVSDAEFIKITFLNRRHQFWILWKTERCWKFQYHAFFSWEKNRNCLGGGEDYNLIILTQAPLFLVCRVVYSRAAFIVKFESFCEMNPVRHSNLANTIRKGLKSVFWTAWN